MKISGLYRHVSRLVAGGTLLVSCILLLGCNSVVRTKTLFGHELDKFPSVVLAAQNHDCTTYVFDWTKATIGGVSLSEFKPKAKYWRMDLFDFHTGERIAAHKADWKLSESDQDETFKNLKCKTLYKVDLDLTDNIETGEDARHHSINVLLLDQPDHH